ncbi:MAG: hypothetical protein J5911_03315 [Clostridia bacterium]|nr:hypothetical protein [Clostridia bacterium]
MKNVITFAVVALCFFGSVACGGSLQDYTGDEHTHVYDRLIDTKEPTCTEYGEITFSCDCGENYSVRLAPIGHDYKSGVIAPDCIAQGYTVHTCTRCGDSYTDNYLPALGHDYQIEVAAPTCTEQGYTIYTCSRCEDSYVADYSDSLGHDYLSQITAPDCTEEGFTVFTCTRCGDGYTDNYLPALGHDYKDKTTAPTCTEQGYTIYTCSRCEDSYAADYINSLGHDYLSQITAPTCTEGGFTVFTCTRCGDSYTADYTDALGHDYSERISEPTCTENGFSTYTCVRCGDSYNEIIAALGHDYGEWTIDGAYAYAKEIGGTVYLYDQSVGRAGAVCSRCGEEIYTEEYNHDIISTELPTAYKDGEMVVYYYFDIYLVAKATIPIILIK